jgi:hypothetical protein
MINSPVIAEGVMAIVHGDLADCDAVRTAVINQYPVDPDPAPTDRYRQIPRDSMARVHV